MPGGSGRCSDRCWRKIPRIVFFGSDVHIWGVCLIHPDCSIGDKLLISRVHSIPSSEGEIWTTWVNDEEIILTLNIMFLLLLHDPTMEISSSRILFILSDSVWFIIIIQGLMTVLTTTIARCGFSVPWIYPSDDHNVIPLTRTVPCGEAKRAHYVDVKTSQRMGPGSRKSCCIFSVPLRPRAPFSRAYIVWLSPLNE